MLSHSDGPSFKRQGITLLYDGQSYRRRLLGLRPVGTGFDLPVLGRHKRLYLCFRIGSLHRLLTRKDPSSFLFVKQSPSPCHCDLPPLSGRQALLLPKLRSCFADFPGLGFPNTPLLSRQVYLLRFSVPSSEILDRALFTGTWILRNSAYAKLFTPSSASPRYKTPRTSMLNLRPHIQMRRVRPLRCRTYSLGIGILTDFPVARSG